MEEESHRLASHVDAERKDGKQPDQAILFVSGWAGEAFAPEELTAVRTWLSGKATTIFGGSQEIQANIVSKRILGLPDTTQNG